MPEEKLTADRLAGFSEAFFAVIVTIMVLELKASGRAAFSALWLLWRLGSGFGLAIAKGVAEAHGGRVRVVSDQGHGSTFVLSIPEAKEPT